MEWLKKLDGYKTYLVALGVVVYGIYLGMSGHMAWTDVQCQVSGCETVMNYVLGGSGLAAVRSALGKIGL